MEAVDAHSGVYVQIPCILSNRDVVLQSTTGSGKTIAYLLPLLLLQLDYVMFICFSHFLYTTTHAFQDFVVLVLVPSQELAVQIEGVIKQLTQSENGVRTALLVGGDSRKQQSHRLRQNANFVVATPGRFISTYRSDTDWSSEVGLLEPSDAILPPNPRCCIR